MYRLTIAFCLAGALLTVICLTHVLPTFIIAIVFGLPEFLVYGIVVGFAYVCRHNTRASSIVLVMALLLLLFSMAIVLTASNPLTWATAIFIWTYQYGQAVIAVVGCYIGYMFVESTRLQQDKHKSSAGRLVVFALVAPVPVVALLIAFILISN